MEDVDNLVEAIKKPGGEWVNPLWATLAAARVTWNTNYLAIGDNIVCIALGLRPQDPDTAPEFIWNIGAKVTAKRMKCLKAVCYLTHHIGLPLSTTQTPKPRLW